MPGNFAMREINLDELKKIELRTLQQLHDLCMQEGLRYSLCGGTLLGAIRHKGFIPWDDDIDVLMPRPDYNRLIAYCQTHETPFRLICSQTESGYGYLFGKAVAKDTVMIEENTNPNHVDMGVYVDIFPVDGMGNTMEEARKNFKAREFAREVLVAKNWSRFFRSKTRSWYVEPIRFAFFLLSRLVPMKTLVKHIEKYYAQFDFDKCEYVACMCGVYRLKEICPREEYTQYIELPFETGRFIGLKEYDKCLTRMYGDYMQLPPEHKRVTHHMFQAYYRE